MTTRIPLGEREDARLEFKSRAVLDGDLGGLIREVVGMLNAAGGAVWVGLADHDGHATAVEGIRDAERARDRLHDVLVDTVEPCPTDEEVAIHVVPVEGGAGILRLTVTPKPTRRPYARLGSRGSRTFLRRVGARNVPMSRDELAQAFATAAGDQDRAAAAMREAQVGLLNERAAELAAGANGLLLLIRPVEDVHLDLGRPEAQRLLMESETDPRLIGFEVTNPYRAPLNLAGALESRQDDELLLRLHEDGRLCLRITNARLLFDDDRDGAYHALGLAAWPTLALRVLARALLTLGTCEEDEVGTFVGDLSILDLASRHLDPRSLARLPFWRGPVPQTGEETHILFPQPVRFSAAELREHPDRCAKHLVRRVLLAFGLPDHRLPPWWTPDDRLVPS